MNHVTSRVIILLGGHIRTACIQNEIAGQARRCLMLPLAIFNLYVTAPGPAFRLMKYRFSLSAGRRRFSALVNRLPEFSSSLATNEVRHLTWVSHLRRAPTPALRRLGMFAHHGASKPHPPGTEFEALTLTHHLSHCSYTSSISLACITSHLVSDQPGPARPSICGGPPWFPICRSCAESGRSNGFVCVKGFCSIVTSYLVYCT